MAYLVLVRHGESTYNAKGLWAGLTDVDLTDKGREDAAKMAEVLKDIDLNVCYVSGQKRAQETWGIMKEICGALGAPTTEAQALNERDYGDFTGKDKWEVKERLGEEEFNALRRSWDHPVPGGETLKDVYERVVPYYESDILPKLQKGQNIVLVAHGNTLRALMKYLDNISDEEFASLEMLLGEVVVYEVDASGEIVNKETRAIKTGPSLA